MSVKDTRYPWLKPLEAKLIGLQHSERLPHALLIEGAEGVGKRDLARWFSQRILCSATTTSETQSSAPCGQCKNCLLFQQGTHPDFEFLEPDEPGKQIKVLQVRELSEFISTHAQQGGYRVIVIAPAEAMNIAASNALLKGLEEPGDKTLFILLSDRPGQLLPTIKSRCQRLTVCIPSSVEATQWLSEQGAENADLALQLCGGSPLRAKALLDDDSLTLRNQLIESLKQTAGNKLSVPDAAQQWLKGDLLQALSWLASLVNDMIRYAQLGTMDHCHNPDAEKLIIRASQRISNADLFAFADKIQEYRQLLLAKHNPNPQLLCEDVLIRWLAIIHKSTS